MKKRIAIFLLLHCCSVMGQMHFEMRAQRSPQAYCSDLRDRRSSITDVLAQRRVQFEQQTDLQFQAYRKMNRTLLELEQQECKSFYPILPKRKL